MGLDQAAFAIQLTRKEAHLAVQTQNSGAHSMQVVIVESPAKAKTINKYLGPDYQVIASFGHVRDLPS